MLIKNESDAKRYSSFWAVPNLDLVTDKTMNIVGAATLIFTTAFTMAVVGTVRHNAKKEVPVTDKVSYVESLSDDELASLTVNKDNINVNGKVYTKSM